MEEMMRVDEETLNAARIRQKSSLESNYGLYNFMKIRDKDAIGMLSKDAYQTASSLEDFLATFSAVRQCTEKYLSSRGLDKKIPAQDLSIFLNMFSTYAGLVEGNCTLNIEDNEKDAIPLDFLNFDEAGNQGSYLDTIISTYKDSVKRNANTGKQMKDLLSLLYRSIEKKVMNEKAKYSMLESEISDIVLSVNSSKIKGFRKENERAEENIVIQDKNSEQYISFEKIIGNSEATESLKRYAEMLFLYNPEKNKNIVSEITYIPRTVFMYARPGTGKTSLASATRNYMQELSEKTGKKFSWVSIDSSIKKKWYGETEEILKAKTEKAMSPNGIGIIFIDDIDGLVVSRSDSSTNAPDKSMTIYLMQLIEGIDTQYCGNYMIISASNKPNDLDEALIERIGEASFPVPGPETEKEYASFLKIKLEKGIKAGYVKINESEWQKAADLCMKYQETLSPRDLTKTMRMLQESAVAKCQFSEMAALPEEEQMKKMKSSFSTITIDNLTAAIEKRYENEIGQKRISEEAEIRRMVDDKKKQMTAMDILMKSIGESK